MNQANRERKMENPANIDKKIIQFFTNNKDDLECSQEFIEQLYELDKLEIIKKIQILGPGFRMDLAEHLEISIMQLDAIFQIYCSDLIKSEASRRLYAWPTLLHNNIVIDLSKKWGVIVKNGDKYTLSDKTVCKKCIDSRSCKKHSEQIVSSPEYIAQNLQLSEYELEDALKVAANYYV